MCIYSNFQWKWSTVPMWAHHPKWLLADGSPSGMPCPLSAHAFWKACRNAGMVFAATNQCCITASHSTPPSHVWLTDFCSHLCCAVLWSAAALAFVYMWQLNSEFATDLLCDCEENVLTSQGPGVFYCHTPCSVGATCAKCCSIRMVYCFMPFYRDVNDNRC